MKIKLKGKNFWKNGAGEMIGFLCVLPFLIFIMALIVSIFHVGAFEERLDYFVYQECRKYVVSGYDGSDNTDFDKFIKETKKSILSDAEEEFSDTSDAKFKKKNIKIEMIDTGTFGQTSGSDSSAYWSEANVSGITPKEEFWIKGEYVKLTISAELTAPLAFMGGEKTSSVVMMIERPANVGGEYPWFQYL